MRPFSMRSVLLCLALAFASTLQAQPEVAVTKIAEGRTALEAHDLATARTKFSEARAADPANQNAAAFLGMTRWLALTGDAPANAFLTGAGVTVPGRNLYDWTASLSENADGDEILPPGYNLESTRVFLRDTLLVTAAEARADLAAVTDPNFVLTMTAAEVAGPADVTIDRGDLLLAQAGLRAFEMALNVFVLGQNLDADLARVLTQGDFVTLKRVLDENPNLFTAGPLAQRQNGRAALLDTIALYRQASTFVRGRAPGVDRLFMLEDADLPDEAELRAKLARIEAGVTGYIPFGESGVPVTIAPLFTAGWSLRGSIPPTTNGMFNPLTLTDTSLGGLLAGADREWMANQMIEAGYHASIGWDVLNPLPMSSNLNEYAYTGTHHIFSGTGGTIARSADGVTWTYQYLPNGQDLFNIVAGSGGRVVAQGTTQVWLSTDHGATWSLSFELFANTDEELIGTGGDIIYTGSQFIFVTTNGYLFKSTDGATWTRNALPIRQGTTQIVNAFGLAYANGRYVAVGSAVVNSVSRSAIFTSTDANNWTLAFTGNSTSIYRAAGYGGGRWVVAGGTARIAYSLNDGQTWAELTTPDPLDTFNGVGFAEGTFVLASTNGRIATSTDAVNWTYSAISPALTNFADAGAGPGGIYLGGSAGAIFRWTGGVGTRLDTNTSFASGNLIFNDTAIFNGKLYLGTSVGTLYESANGTSYTERPTSTTNSLNSLTVHNGELFAAGGFGTIVSSTDGVSWQTRISNNAALTTNAFNKIASVNGQLIAVAGGGVIVTSPDGVTWTRRTSPSTATLRTVAHGGGYYLIGMDGAQVPANGWTEVAVLYSTDAISWTRQVMTTVNGLIATGFASVRSIDFTDGRFNLYLNNGTVIQTNGANPTQGNQWLVGESLVGLTNTARVGGLLYANASRLNAQARSSLYYSLDGGEEWVQSELPSTINGTAPREFAGKLFLAGGNGVVYRSQLAPGIQAPTGGSAVTLAGGSGGTITLATPVAASEQLTYQWSFNGTTIGGATESTLTLPALTAGQAGTYTLTATGSQTGATTTSTVTLTVDASAPVITRQPAGGTFALGSTATLSVGVAGTGPFTYLWYKNGSSTGIATATLTLSSISAGGAGAYTVAVTNASGTTLSAPAQVTTGGTANLAAFWRVMTEGQTAGYSPARTIHDGAGHIYSMWAATGRPWDVIANTPAASLVRLNESDGSIDPTFVWNSAFGIPLYAVVQTNGKLLVAVAIGSSEGNTVIRVNADGTRDNTFTAPYFNRGIRFLTLQADGKVVVSAVDATSLYPPGGSLSPANPTIYRLNADGTQDGGFTPAGLSVGSNIFGPPVVDAGGKIYLAGAFTSAAGATRTNVARLNSDGTADTAFAASMPAGYASTQARGVAVQSDGRAVFVGDFRYTARGTAGNPILAIRFNADGTFDNTFVQPLRNETPMNTTLGVRLRMMALLPGDGFLAISDRLMRFNADGSYDGTFAVPNYSLETFWVSVSPTSGKIFVPDVLDAPGDIAAYTSAGVAVSGFDTGGWGRAMTPLSAEIFPNGQLLVTGSFNRFGTTTLPGVALLSPEGNLVTEGTEFYNPASRPVDPVMQLAGVPDGSFYMRVRDNGNPLVAGTASDRIDRFTANGVLDGAWSFNEMSFGANQITAAPTGELYVWVFAQALSLHLTNPGDWVRRYHSDGSRDYSFSLDTSLLREIIRDGTNTITSMKMGRVIQIFPQPDGSLLVSIVSIQNELRVIKLLSNGSLDPAYTSVSLTAGISTAGFSVSTFDPVKGSSYQIPQTTYTAPNYGDMLALPDGRAYVAGSFTAPGAPVGIVRLLANGSVDPSFTGVGLANTGVHPLWAFGSDFGLDDSGRVYLAGRFTSVNGFAAAGLVRFTTAGTLDTAWAPGIEVRADTIPGTLLVGRGGRLHVVGGAALPGSPAEAGYLQVPLTDTTPVIMGQSSNQALSAGQSGVQLYANAFAGSGGTFQWYRNDVAVLGATTPYLNLGVVGAGSAGTYHLTVTNGQGTVDSADIVVTVSDLPGITEQPSGATVSPGTSVTFMVSAVSATPLSYQWRKGGVDIDGAISADYTITGVTAGHAGSYTVVVTNTNGSVESDIAVLAVGSAPTPPVITVQPVGQNVAPGFTTSLSVTATGTGLTYQWYRDGGAVAGGTTATLLVTNPTVNTTFHVVVSGSNGGAVTSNMVTLTAEPAYAVSTLAGTASAGSFEGTGNAARFSFPVGIASDASGNLYIADQNIHSIRKVTPAGVVSTFAGLSGSSGSTNATGTAARFNSPRAIAIDGSGNLYVTEGNAHTIRKITPGAVVTTVAGTANSSGNTDGTGAAVRFNTPRGIVVDSSGIIYVADSGNHTIRKIATDGTVTTLAGSAGLTGSTDNTGALARFNTPLGLALDGSGNILVADSNNHTIRQVTPAGVVTTLAGSGVNGTTDGTGTAAQFSSPTAIVVDPSGYFFVTESGGQRIRQIAPGAIVTGFAGQGFSPGWADGTGTAARFSGPQGIARSPGGNLYVSDSSNNTVRQVTSSAVVTTLAGLPPGYNDATGSAARFFSPQNVARDSSDNLYVTDRTNHVIRKITPAGVVTTFAGLAGVSQRTDGLGSAARFASPTAIAMAPDGALWVADGSNTIRRITPDGNVTTIAGVAFGSGNNDGTGTGTTAAPGTSARFGSNMNGLAVSAAGDAYVSDTNSHTIRKVTPAGVVTTFAGTAGTFGTTNATGTAAQFSAPSGLAFDSAGNLFVADRNNRTIRKITSGGVVTTYAGLAGNSNNTDGTLAVSRFNNPFGLAMDGSNNLYVTDTALNSLRRISPSGTVTTLVGNNFGAADGIGNAVRFNNPQGVVILSNGGVAIVDTNNHTIRTGFSGSQVQITTQPVGQSALVGATVTFSVVASGSPSLSYQWVKGGSDISGETGASLVLNDVQTGAAGTYNVRVTNGAFTALSANAVLTVTAAHNNDNFAAPAVLSGLTGGLASSNTVATGETGEPVHFNATTTSSAVWFAWTPPVSGTGYIDTFGSAIDTAIAVYTGNSLDSLAFLAQNNDSVSTTQSRVVLPVTAGTTYRIAVGGNTGQRGAIQLNVGVNVRPTPGGQVVNLGQPASFAVEIDPAATPSVTVSWNKNGSDAGSSATTLTLPTVTAADAGVYQPGFAQGGSADFSRSLPAYLITAGNAALTATDSFDGTALDAGWAPTQFATPTADDTQFSVSDRIRFSTPVTPTGFVYREQKRNTTVPLDRNWSAVLRVGVSGGDIPGLGGVGAVREAAMTLGAFNPADSRDFFSTGLRAYNTSGTAQFERYAVTSTNDVFTGAGAVAHTGIHSALVRLDYVQATGQLTASSSTGGAFTVLGSIDVLTTWGLTRSEPLYLYIGAYSDRLNIPVGAIWADDFASIVQPPAPVITVPPASQTVTAGANVTFNVTATNADTYQWYLNDVAISGATGSSLYLPGVDAGDAGDYSVVVTNGGGSTTSADGVLTVNVGGFEAFRTASFTEGELGNSLISGPAADPDSDGFSNLMEYALGLAPKAASTTGLPGVSVVGSDWVYTYTRPADISDITYTVEASTNLTSWTTASVTHEHVSTSGNVATWRAKYPLASAANINFRLKVSSILP